MIAVEPRSASDPATDAALKRRVEQEIREAAGNRLRSVDVRVQGRYVTIRARAARLFQRRSLKHTIEGVPALNGLRPRIEVGY